MGGWIDVLGRPRTWAADFALAVAIGVFLGLIGPFGSYGRPLLERIVFCVSLGCAGTALYYPLIRGGLALGARVRAPLWLALPLAIALACGPLTLLVAWLEPRLWPGDLDPSPPGLLLYVGVLSICAPLTIARVTIGRMLGERQVAAAPVPAAGPPRLLLRLPPRLGGDILALQAEDHYVRIHTAKGSHLVLMRLADAIAETDGLSGLRVHRSWWVARAAVAGVRREGRSAVLDLGGGLTAPVARNAMREARALGLLNAG